MMIVAVRYWLAPGVAPAAPATRWAGV